MWWVIGGASLFIILFCYCACVLAGRADDKKSEWIGRGEEGIVKSNPSEREFRDARRREGHPSQEPSAFPLFGSGLVGARKKI